MLPDPREKLRETCADEKKEIEREREKQAAAL